MTDSDKIRGDKGRERREEGEKEGTKEARVRKEKGESEGKERRR